MVRTYWVALALLLLLAACDGPSQLIDNNMTGQGPPIVIEEPPARPEILRTYDPADWEDDLRPTDNSTIILPNRSVFILVRDDEVEFRMPLGFALGDAYPVLDSGDLPLLKPAAIRTGDNHFRGYKQYLRFGFDENSTGNVTFVLDDSRDPEYLGTALFFAEGMPVFEYALLLNDRPFFDPRMIGSDVMILGSSFQVHEATNDTLIMNGIDTAQYLRITDNKSLETNRKRITGTLVRYDGFGFIYRMYARDIDSDGFMLREGESLRQRMADDNRPEAIIGDHFDITYEGLEPLDPGMTASIILDSKGDRVDLVIGEMRIPLLGYREDGLVWHGDDSRRLHVKECANKEDVCIRVDDQLLVEGRIPDRHGMPGAPVTELLRLSSIDYEERMVIFRDNAGNRIGIDWDNKTGYARLPFLDREYGIYVKNVSGNLSISMDLDGTSGVNGKRIPFMLADGLMLEIENPTNTTAGDYVLNMTIETAPYDQRQMRHSDGTLNKELLRLQLVASGGDVRIRVPQGTAADSVTDETLFIEPDEEFAMTVTPWGSVIRLEIENDNEPQESLKDLKLDVPLLQRFAIIRIG